MQPPRSGEDPTTKTLATKTRAPAKMSVGAFLLYGALAIMLIASAAGFALVMAGDNIARISLHGWIAMSLGVALSLLIGCGLMWLSFFSARQGYDDRADPRRAAATAEKDPM